MKHIIRSKRSTTGLELLSTTYYHFSRIVVLISMFFVMQIGLDSLLQEEVQWDFVSTLDLIASLGHRRSKPLLQNQVLKLNIELWSVLLLKSHGSLFSFKTVAFSYTTHLGSSMTISAPYMTVNSVFHAQRKHIKLDYHFVCEKVTNGSLITRFVLSYKQLADIFTKPLTKTYFFEFITNNLAFRRYHTQVLRRMYNQLYNS